MDKAKPLQGAAERLKRRPGRPRKGHSPGIALPEAGHQSGPEGRTLAQEAIAHIPPRCLDVKGAALYLGGISTWTVRDFHSAGMLPRVCFILNGKEVRRLLFDVEDLNRLIERSKE